ncbi:MAG: metallophosphoesterase [Firmicutes bacterium]|nr:metallophosphoesterase [Bacillota bacterium]
MEIILFPVMDSKNRKGRTLRILLLVIAVLAGFFLVVMAIDCNRFVIRKYRYRTGKLKKDGKVILLSDLHNKSFGKGNYKLVEAIRRINPDLILVAGDMYTSNSNGDILTAQELICTLAREYPVYYGNGNHEHKTRLFPEYFGTMYQEFSKKIEEAGAKHLVNEKITLPEYNVDIYGLEIGREYYGKFKTMQMEAEYIETLLGKPDQNRTSVLIAHNPDYFEAYARWGADLVVSGHIHGGLMRLPVLGGVLSPAIKLFPKYDGGEFKEESSTMILGRGLGTHTLPIRIFNPGELVVIELCQS